MNSDMPDILPPKEMRKIIPHSKRSKFGTLDIFPYEVTFATQDKGEKVYIKVRSHIITNFGWLFRASFLMVLPLLLILIYLFLINFFESTQGLVSAADSLREFSAILEEFHWTVYLAIGLFYYSVIWTYVLINFLNWYFNIYLVTNERIINIQFKALSGKKVTEAPLDNIEDINQSIIGFLPSFFNYGDVRIQTAATKGKLIMKSVPEPTWFRDIIADLGKLFKNSNNRKMNGYRRPLRREP